VVQISSAFCFAPEARASVKTAPMRTKASDALKVTAYHEAGHAVAAIAFDYLVESNILTIEPNGDALGSVAHPPPLMQGCQTKRELRTVVDQMCIGSYEGLAAERLFDPSAPDFDGEDDEIQAWNLPRNNGIAPRGCQFVGDDVYGRYLERLKRKAEAFVEAQRPAIEALAAALLKKKTMTGAEAIQIVRPCLRWSHM
jgi:ATP-dependent Zn protease